MNEETPLIINGYAYPTIEPGTLAAWLPGLTFLSSFSYGFRPDGTLTELDDSNLRGPSGDVGVRTLLVLTPLDEEGMFSNELVHMLLEDTQAQERLIGNLGAAMKIRNMFGVDFDFEYVFPEDRERYVSFVERASEVLNAEGFLVTAALAPKTSDDQPGLLYQGHDYAGLGQAANFVLIMTYEWGYAYGPPLPVAPLSSVRRVLDYSISRIAPDKILMGIPNYGYDWTLPFIRGESRAEKISNGEAVRRAAEHGVPINFDEEYQSPYYYYYGDDEHEHVVWFEDERSWEAKFRLVHEYGLAGISIWNIMDDFPGGRAVLDESFEVLKI